MSGVMILRADGGARIGIGHVMRCMALGQAWRKCGGDVVFASAESDDGIAGRLQSEGFTVAAIGAIPGSEADCDATAELAHRHGADWVVADSYRFGAEYQERLRRRGCRVVFVDDNGHAGHYSAEVVLNQNIHATPDLYESRERHTRLLLGLKYTLLRREFWRWRDWRRPIVEGARRVLIVTGGADATNSATAVLEGLRSTPRPELEIKVVVGPSNPHGRAIEKAAAGMNHRVELMSGVSDLVPIMAWCDVAVAAAGCTMWELAALETPCVLLITAENQVAAAASMAHIGAAPAIDCIRGTDGARVAESVAELLADTTRRSRMAESAGRLVDGKGVWRVIDQLGIPAGMDGAVLAGARTE